MASTKEIIFLLVVATFIVSSSGAVKGTQEKLNPFDTLTYDRVIAYDYDGSPQRRIVNNGVLFFLPGKIYKQKELTKDQIDKLNGAVGNPKSYGGSTAACFDPHFGVVFYKQKKIVAHMSICLACNRLESFPVIPAIESHKADLCDTCYAEGFSKSGRKKISALVRELQFSHWQLDSELFDK